VGATLEKNMVELCHMVILVVCDTFSCHFVLFKSVNIYTPTCVDVQILFFCTCIIYIQLLLQSLCQTTIMHNCSNLNKYFANAVPKSTINNLVFRFDVFYLLIYLDVANHILQIHVPSRCSGPF